MTDRLFLNDKVMITDDGGIAISLLNKTGATSVKGKVAEPADGNDAAFSLCAVDSVDPIGIIYGDNAGSQVADGVACWIVVAGLAYIMFESATTRGHFARMGVAADANDAAGLAMSEALPTSPFATDKHFAEVGHVLETIGGAGLALCMVHFN